VSSAISASVSRVSGSVRTGGLVAGSMARRWPRVVAKPWRWR
jgi:hypothetical protein